jgi:hypothetical protein
VNENSLKNLKPWKPGQHGGGVGQVRLPPELRAARRENMSKLIQVIHEYVALTDEEAKEKLSGPGGSQLEEMVQGQIMKAKEGDSRAFQYIMEVMCGKIPEADESTSADSLTLEEKIKLMKQGLAVLEAQAGTPRPSP